MSKGTPPNLLQKLLHVYQLKKDDSNALMTCKKMEEKEDIVKSETDLVDNESIVINIFVTLYELETYPTIIKDLVKLGHFFGLTLPDKCTSVNYSALISESHEKFTNVIGTPPLWINEVIYPTSVNIWTPSTFLTFKSLGMRVYYCSTHVEISQEFLSCTQMNSIVEDIMDKLGGSFIYLLESEIMREKGLEIIS